MHWISSLRPTLEHLSGTAFPSLPRLHLLLIYSHPQINMKLMFTSFSSNHSHKLSILPLWFLTRLCFLHWIPLLNEYTIASSSFTFSPASPLQCALLPAYQNKIYSLSPRASTMVNSKSCLNPALLSAPDPEFQDATVLTHQWFSNKTLLLHPLLSYPLMFPQEKSIDDSLSLWKFSTLLIFLNKLLFVCLSPSFLDLMSQLITASQT